MMRSVLVAAGATLAITLGTVSASGQAPQKSASSGVYTAAQAVRGKTVFGEKCTACHEPSRFSGATFFESFGGKPLKDVWDIASGTMPEDNPGSLKPQEYAEILAYFLELNEFPKGESELQGNGAAMANILVDKPKK
jgi:mono/diheme cytochrome c family protein